MTILTADGIDAELDEDHWKTHIVKGHPELTPYQSLVIETLKHPEGVYRSTRDSSTRVYARSCLGILIGETLVEKINLLVFVREKNAFVVTAFFAAVMWRGLGERIWPL